ncbi:hypothetical protein [Rhizobium rhizogenes]|uniref:hypothetical protein n=1 Tax=Rhizobium rhizogenes TaxID=359 RepID=UPI00080FF1CE|nr:hypothetical protein [Rhizobium rhizogenes]NTI46662.1 hypothetical protein [Rhizobium rhizogenes]OCJ14994.1 hypothetical protein A6U88_33955 [Agrobacterium sp. B131/95]
MRSESNFALCSALAALLTLGSSTAMAACNIPNPLSNGQTADATKLMDNFTAVAGCVDALAPSGGQNTVQFKTTTGSLGGVPLSDGQILVGTTSGAPQAKALTAGPGIEIVNSPGGIAISAISSGSANAVDWLNEAAVIRPSAGDFSLVTSTTAPTGASLVPTVRGMALTTTSAADATSVMAETATPSGHWQATMLAVYSGPLSTYSFPAIAVRDSIARRAVEFGISSMSVSTYQFAYTRSVGGQGLDAVAAQTVVTDIGLPPPSQPIWSRLTYDGTNLSWSFSRDGEVFSTAFTISAADNLTSLDRVGPAAFFQQPTHPGWPSAYHILSWRLASL